jgi:single-stranded-DNA-specific exonuclease
MEPVTSAAEFEWDGGGEPPDVDTSAPVGEEEIAESGAPPVELPSPSIPPRIELRRADGPDTPMVRARAQQLGVHPLAIRLLSNREVDDDLASHLDPKLGMLRRPDEMAGFVAALDVLTTAHSHGWRVGVFGDYDVDGVSTAAIIATYLEAIGMEVVVRVAHRDRGYGFGIADAQALHEAGARVVVTCDTGTSDGPSLQWLADRDVRTVVIDHHQVPTIAPPADGFINPHQASCGFPFKGLCSAGVAFYLCAALRTRLLRTHARVPDPRGWLDLVAVATICDMMPLREENRVLVHAGLRHLNQRGRPGLRALLQQAGVADDEPVDEQHVAFKLGPRLNAPGRLGPAEPALRLLRARTDAEAGPLAEHVEMLNAQRKRCSDSIFAEALAVLAADPRLDQRAGLVVAHDRWQAGIVGIAAAKIVDHHHRPTAVLAIDRDRNEARGSVRGLHGIDVRAALQACSDLLIRFGGHREAAGVTLAADKVDAFTEAFDAAIAVQAAAPAGGDIEVVDCTLPLRVVEAALCDAMRRAGPFGMGFAPPRFLAEDVVVDRVRVLKERHLSLTLQQDGGHRRECIAFGQAGHALLPGEHIDCIFVPFLDRFRGETRLRLQIERLWRRA